MDSQIRDALQRGGIADITTTGRKTGQPRRIEIYFHHFDGDYYLTGRPGPKRDWEANIEAEPRFTLHLTKGPIADLAMVGETEPDREQRARIIRRALIESWGSPPDRVDARLDEWVADAPLVRFRPA
jgi:deazaflavin-dependent oxidoreductase (nitroreductase family)